VCGIASKGDRIEGWSVDRPWGSLGFMEARDYEECVHGDKLAAAQC